MLLKDILYHNALKMRHKDKFVIILKTDAMKFTLGENTFHSWIAGEMDTLTYLYICKCLEAEVDFTSKRNYIDFILYKIYISDIELQREIYELEDKEYNRRLNK